jgi:S1-C subfamily serine protease
VAYDREEWRRPWRPGEVPIPVAESRPSLGAEPANQPAESAEDAAQPMRQEPTQPIGTEPTQRLGTEPTQPVGGWQRPDGSEARVPVAGVDPSEPIARYPQPPPTGWGATAQGPGSPVGSVRPPDTTGTVDPPASPRRGGGLLRGAALALAGGVVGAAAVLAVSAGMETGEPVADEVPVDPTTETVTAPSIQPLSESSIVPAVAEAVTPSVVRIDVGNAGAGGTGGAALGSGVIYRSDGYVLTNHHVIEAAIESGLPVRVRLANGEQLDAEIIGADELNDLAVLRVEESGLPAINLRPEDEPVIVGETVVAIGSPFGLDATVTAGILSALNREIRLEDAGEGPRVIPNVLQTDAAINPGNSGGALVDAQGRLLGINTAILTRSGASQGVGFAVSAEQAVLSADQLIEQGFVRHPLLGVSGMDVTPEIAERFDMPSSRGVVVDSVQEDTGAAAADIRAGDIIVEIDGEPLATISQLVAEVRRRAPGDVVVLEVLRDGAQFTVEVELGERPRTDD